MSRSPFQEFELENWQSKFEQTVRFNLSDSTIEPLTVADVLELAEETPDILLDTALYYPEVNGERSLRTAIAGGYPGSGYGADDVLVTVGASEANALIVDALCAPGDHVIVMEPGYRQVWGMARNLGCDVSSFSLQPEEDWRPDLDQLALTVRPDTRLIYICNPNNPTGYVLTRAEQERIMAIADRSGAWLLADEVYQGSERQPQERPRSFAGLGERVICVNSLSKSYGLSGLRIGWAIGPRGLIAQLWRRHEYVAIATGRLDNALAQLALQEPARTRILARNRLAVQRGWNALAPWLEKHQEVVTLPQPQSTGLAFLRYAPARPSLDVADEIRRRASTLVCPGSYFGIEGFLRLNYAMGLDVVSHALQAMDPVIEEMNER